MTRKGRKKQKIGRGVMFLAVVAVVVVAVFVVVNSAPFEFNFNFPDMGGNGNGDGNGGSGDGDNGGDNGDDGDGGSDYVPPSCGIASLTVQIEPNPCTMGDRVYGQVVGGGEEGSSDPVAGCSVTLHTELLATGTGQSYTGLLDSQGKFTDSREINIPGYWDIWATCGSVTSNMPRLRVEGVLIDLPSDHYSRTLGSPVTAMLFSHTSGNAQINAVNHEFGTTTYLTNTVINTNGYGEVSLDFGVLSTGTYEIEVLINGLDSSDYDGSAWLTVGR